MRGVAAEVINDKYSSQGHNERLATARELMYKETADLLERHQRMSVRDLASKFETGQAQAAAHAAASRLGQEVKEAAHLDKPTLMKKLRSLLKDLSGRVAGRNKDDLSEALATLDVMELQWSQHEMEAAIEKAEARNMAAMFQKASEDANKMIEKVREEARAEVEAAGASALRVQEALEAQAHPLSTDEHGELVELRKEVKEARRIMMLHAPSKVMDMECEIAGLHQQLRKKALEVVILRKKLEAGTRNSQVPIHFSLRGEEQLGSTLAITRFHATTPEIAKCKLQWHRVSVDGMKAEPIIGATRPQYAPEPHDVGKVIRVDIWMPDDCHESIATSGPLDSAPGLGLYVEGLVQKGGAEFNVKIFQENGEYATKSTFQMLVVHRLHVRLYKGHTTRAKEEYSSAMQLCGARGGGDAAARSLYWVAHKNLTFMLVLESERERNAAILLARRFAFDCNVQIILGGPDD